MPSRFAVLAVLAFTVLNWTTSVQTTWAASPSGAEGGVQKSPIPLESPTKTILPNGRNNWSQAYAIQSMEFLLETTGDDRWAKGVVSWGLAALAARDALHPVDKRPFAWTDRSDLVLEPYVWSGFTGHSFAPLMAFSAYVLQHPDLGSRSYHGKPFREYAALFMHEFTRALDVHRAELFDDGRHAYFRFARPVPVKNRQINGQPLPPNMNAALFTAILYLAKAERHEGRVDSADALSRSVSHFVAYLNDEILLREQCGSRWCIRWQYASYIRRVEDVGHANNVIRFLVAAQEEHYPVPYHHLVEIANTIDTITNPDGSFRSNLLDGSSIEGTRDSIYDILLLARYSPSLKSKFQAVMAHGPSFSYLGPWRAANR